MFFLICFRFQSLKVSLLGNPNNTNKKSVLTTTHTTITTGGGQQITVTLDSAADTYWHENSGTDISSESIIVPQHFAFPASYPGYNLGPDGFDNLRYDHIRQGTKFSNFHKKNKKRQQQTQADLINSIVKSGLWSACNQIYLLINLMLHYNLHLYLKSNIKLCVREFNRLKKKYILIYENKILKGS